MSFMTIEKLFCRMTKSWGGGNMSKRKWCHHKIPIFKNVSKKNCRLRDLLLKKYNLFHIFRNGENQIVPSFLKSSYIN